MKTTCWQIRVLSVLSNIHKLEIGKQDDVEEQVSLLALKAYFEICCVLRNYLATCSFILKLKTYL